MNIHQSATLTSQLGTHHSSRWWAYFTRTAFVCAIVLVDVSAIILMSHLTGIAYHLVVYGHEGEAAVFLQVGILSAIIFGTANLFRGEYALANFYSFRSHVRRSIQLWNATFVCLLPLAFITQMTEIYSRGSIVLFYASTICVLLGLRYLSVQVIIHGSQAGLISAQRIFLVGTDEHIEQFMTRYQPTQLGVNVVGHYFLTPAEASVSPTPQYQALAQEIDEAALMARSVEPEAIFLVMPWSATETINRCAESFLRLPAEIHLGPEEILDRFENIQISKLGPMASLQLTRMPLSRFERFEKRAFDLVFAAFGLVLFAPLLLVIATLIRLDSPGPAFFLQRRYGFNQKPFRIIKFRMRTLDDGAVVRQATRDDPRITRVGAWLRCWNIDEIPQLLNVLKGDMSLVGPRPHALSHNHDYERRISFYARRHNVKPGITGWAQIHGLRGETDTEEKMMRRVEHDLYYIHNWSPWLDVTILIRTLISPSSYRNAY